MKVLILAACVALIAMSMPVQSQDEDLIAAGYKITFDASSSVKITEEDWMFPKLYPNTHFEHFKIETIDKEQTIILVRVFNDPGFDTWRDIDLEAQCRRALEEMGASDIKQALIAGQDGTFFRGMVAGKKVFIGEILMPEEHQRFMVVKYTGDIEGFQDWLNKIRVSYSERKDLSYLDFF
jgi:hypothetical protein